MLAQTIAPLVDLIYPPRCPLCGEGIAGQTGLCVTCWADLELPDVASLPQGVVAGVVYNDAARKLVLAFKHGGRIALAPMLARLMFARLPELAGDWVIVPVPLHRWRLWHRGYNQSALLARELANLTRQPLVVDGLVRHRRTASLGGLGREERWQMVSGAIRTSKGHAKQFAGSNVLLVDDVYTTGATSQACATVLREAGAARVETCCFALVGQH